MVLYTTQAEDMLDWICYRYYGESRDYTEAVRDANPHLSAYGPRLPAGVVIQLPDFAELTRAQTTIRLWD